ncbi:MAG: RNA polymerase sigma factor [Phycisphaerae bacterium]
MSGSTQQATPARYWSLLQGLLERAAGYARSILRSRHDAEDAVQQAALRGLERFSTYDAARPFKGWWFAVLRNCCMDVLRSRRPAADAAVVEAIAAQPPGEEWEELATAIARLAPEHGEILRMRYFGELSYRELAAALDVPEGTVMSRLHYARKALADELNRSER